MSAKNYRLWTSLIILIGAVGIGAIGANLITRYLQTQQTLQMRAADDLLAQKQYDSALKSYDRLLKQEKLESERLWTNRGYALLGLKQYEAANKSCTNATSLQPKAVLAWNCRGEALYYLDRLNDALAAFERAVALDSRNPTFQLNQGKVLAKISQHESAIEVLSKAISQLESKTPDPNPADLAIAFNDLGHSLLAQQQNQRALKAFERSLAYQPKSVSAQQGKGIALYRLGRYQQAIAIFERLEKQELSSEQQAINRLYKGVSLCHTLQDDKAEEAFAKVIELTDNPQSQKIAKAGCGIR